MKTMKIKPLEIRAVQYFNSLHNYTNLLSFLYKGQRQSEIHNIPGSLLTKLLLEHTAESLRPHPTRRVLQHLVQLPVQAWYFRASSLTAAASGRATGDAGDEGGGR